MLKLKDLLKRKTEWAIYSDCDTLPLYNFIEVLTSGNLNKLIIKGNPPQPEILKAWQSISEDYNELSNSVTSKQLLALQIDIEYYRNQLRITQLIIDEIAKRGYSEECAELLRELGYAVVYSGDINATLTMILNQTRSIQTDLEDRMAEYKGMQEKGEKETTKIGYYELLADMGITNVHSYFVTQFIGAYNLYKNKNSNGPGQVKFDN